MTREQLIDRIVREHMSRRTMGTIMEYVMSGENIRRTCRPFPPQVYDVNGDYLEGAISQIKIAHPDQEFAHPSWWAPDNDAQFLAERFPGVVKRIRRAFRTETALKAPAA